MPIQFNCEGCRQPIEVDDEAANMRACCPFCSAVVQVPAVSDVAVARPDSFTQPTAVLQTAAPVPHRPGAPSDVARQFAGAAADRPNPSATFGFLAMTTIIISVVLFASVMIASMLAMLPHMPPPGAMPDYAALNEKMMAYYESSSWVAVAAGFSHVLGFVGVGMAIGSLVRRERPRWPAMTVLGTGVGFLVLLICSGMALTMLG